MLHVAHIFQNPLKSGFCYCTEHPVFFILKFIMADYTAILAAIDAAILAGAAKPLTLSVAGKSNTYRTLTELIEARKYYTQLQASAGDIRDGFKVGHFQKGGAY